jgi:polar amino acid transport system substrate-binding protein
MKILSFLFLFCSFATVSAQNQQITLASDIWPPFTDQAGKQSIALELVQEALKKGNIDTKIEITEFKTLLEGIKSGVYDGSAALWSSEARKSDFKFSLPYFQNRLVLVGRKGMDVGARSLAELEGKNIAVVDDYAYELPKSVADKITFTYAKSTQEVLELLLNGQADYMLMDALILQYLLTYQQADVQTHLAVGTTPLINRTLHLVLRSDLENVDAIIDMFNQQIGKMVADGSYNEILQLNWIQADVDGDGKTEMVLNGDRAGKQAPSDIYNLALQNTESVMLADNSRYYIEGKVYDSWNQVPDNYKVDHGGNMGNDIGLLSFGLNKKK